MSAAVYLNNCSTMWMRPSFMWYKGCIGVLLPCNFWQHLHCIYNWIYRKECFLTILPLKNARIFGVILSLCKSGGQLGQYGSLQRNWSPRCTQTWSPCSRSISVVFLSFSDLFQWTRHPPLIRAGGAWLSPIDFYYTQVLSWAHEYRYVFGPSTQTIWCSHITSDNPFIICKYSTIHTAVKIPPGLLQISVLV